jgi:hypothetical protein
MIAELLVDTGTDRTAMSANVLEALSLDAAEPHNRIGGVGGLGDSVTLNSASYSTMWRIEPAFR